MIAPGRRTLLDAALQACGASGSPTRYRLVMTDPTSLGLLGPTGVVHGAACLDDRRTASPSEPLGRLHIFVVAEVASDGVVQARWIVDGWRLLRADGVDVDLRGVNLRGADLRGARLMGCDLSEADLTGADLEKADLTAARLVGANLSGSVLFSASLRRADLTEAELCRADMRHADLREATCVRTALRGADLWGAYTWEVDFSTAFTQGAQLDRADHLNTKVS
jgi:uncharacterized protein YjbI with pentapeptide repeats